MVPWPIALLALWYGALATSSAAMVWKILTGQLHQSLLWATVGFVFSGATMYGLVLLKSWARRLAVSVSCGMIALLLFVAGLLVMYGRPLGGILVAVAAGLHVMIIRYLQRQTVKAHFS